MTNTPETNRRPIDEARLNEQPRQERRDWQQSQSPDERPELDPTAAGAKWQQGGTGDERAMEADPDAPEEVRRQQQQAHELHPYQQGGWGHDPERTDLDDRDEPQDDEFDRP